MACQPAPRERRRRTGGVTKSARPGPDSRPGARVFRDDVWNVEMVARKRSTKTEQAALDEQIVEVLRADYPQSVRHAFYRMTDPRLAEPVPKTEHGYQRVQRRCLALRRLGRLPYGWISDATRRGYHVSTFADAGDFIQRMSGLYRAQLWTRELPHVEVWVESRGLAGVLQRECRELAVSLYPCGGFASATLAYEAAHHINGLGRDRVVVLYVGDFDPAGLLIDQSLEAELRRHLKVQLDFRRLAINESQIEEYDLPTKPRKTTDKHRLDVQAAVEVEAMPAAEMRRIVREAVESYLPEGALHAVRVAEESEREGLRALARGVSDHGIESVL